MSDSIVQRLQAAMDIVNGSRQTHVEWLQWQQSEPNWREVVKQNPDSPGDEDHHQRCIQRYDQALKAIHDAINELSKR